MTSNITVAQPVVSQSQKAYLEMKLLHVAHAAISSLEQAEETTKIESDLLPKGFTTCKKCKENYPSSLTVFHQKRCQKRPNKLRRTLATLCHLG